MKSLVPSTATAAIILRLLASATLDSVAANIFPFDKPTFRYTPFQNLDTTTQTIAEEKLGYIELTWNNHGLAPVEKSGWSSLTSNERGGAELLGFEQNTWDCFVNHYEDSTWEELAEKGAQAHFESLGWSQAHWEYTSDTLPYTEGRWWGQLTDQEKTAANGLCYFEDNWNRLDMNPNSSFFPHPMPTFRYKPWDALSSVAQNVAGGMLNYTEDMWNTLGTSILEKNTFLNLASDKREGAMELGFYPHTWDCFMNHYRAYYWSSFHDDLSVAMETLGWNETMWREGIDAPASEDLYWIDLLPDEKAAATRLCYFKEIWDQEPIPKWYDYETGMSTAISSVDPLPNDINLDIFEETGYVGKPPGSIGAAAFTTLDVSQSYRALASSNIVAVGLSMGVLLLV